MPMNAKAKIAERDVVPKGVLIIAQGIPVELDVMLIIVLILATLQNAEKIVKRVNVPHFATANSVGKTV